MPSQKPPFKNEPVERTEKLSKAEFYENFAEGAGKPVIVTDAMDDWAVLSKWTFDFFRTAYGDDIVQATDKLSRPDVLREVNLAEFIDYIESPGSSSLRSLEQGIPLYLLSYKPFLKHPELLNDFSEYYFVDDFFQYLPQPYKEWYNQGWIHIGPAGTISHLHWDFWHTQALLAQVEGRKKCILFSPQDTPYLYKGEVDPLKPDFDTFPLFREAKPYEAVLAPGEVLFIPGGWWHHVVALENSITLAQNIFNHSNFAFFLEDVIRDLPRLLMPFNSPSFREALKVKWKCKGFVMPSTYRAPDLEFHLNSSQK